MRVLALPLPRDTIITAADDTENEGRARDNRLHDVGGSRKVLVAGDDGDIHAEAAVDEGGWGRR